MSFSSDVTKWTRKVESRLDTAFRKIALDVFSRVILRSPVDTGRFRGNWQVSIGAIPSGTVELNDKTGQATISSVQAEVLNLKAGEIIFLVNNSSYSLPLEYGHSSQAPNGMVRLTVQEFQPIVDAVAREVSKTP